MGQGLGKNSAVVLSLGKENYEALIARHGQWMRWRVATRCPCVNANTLHPDIRCTKCGGLGFVYSAPDTTQTTRTVMVKDNSGIVELDGECKDFTLVRVYDNSGREYAKAAKTGQYVKLNDVPPVKGVYITAVMNEDSVKTLRNAKTVNIGGGFYRIAGLRVSKPSIEGLTHDAPCDIVEVRRLVDSSGEVWQAAEYRQDCVLVAPNDNGDMPQGDLTAEGVKYIAPFVFALLGQTLSQADGTIREGQTGEATLSYPYGCDVAEDDVLTVLSGSYTKKAVIKRREGNSDVIGAYFVECVSVCMGRRRYVQGEDFALVGNNRIIWMCADAPLAGEAYSITYHILPTYKVMQTIPQIRTSENQRMPRKAVVKLFDAYSERRGVGIQ